MEHEKLPVILILSSAEEAETRVINDDFVAALNQQLGGVCHIIWRNYHEVGLEFATDSIRAFLLEDGTDLNQFAHVYIKSYFRFQEQASAIMEYLSQHDVPATGKELKSYIPATKLTQLARLSRAGLPIPKTLYMSTGKFPEQYETLVRELGVKFIFKAIDGSTGEDNYLIKSKQELDAVVAENSKMHFIAQAFVPNDSDMRVLIVGGKIRLVIDRRRADDTTHLNNTSQGASATMISLDTLSSELQALSLKAAEVMGREVAGVDLMLEKGNGQPFILEVNASPQIASGAFMDEKLAIYKDYFTEISGN